MTRILAASIRRLELRTSRAVAMLALTALSQPAIAFAQSPVITPFLCRNGAEEAYTVPADVSQVYVVAAGAAGAGTTAKPGTTGGMVAADVPVEPGQALSVQVGCVGGRASDVTGGRGGAGYGRGGDGGSSAFETSNGGGGGGSTAVLDGASNPLLVAAGGGGAGGAAGTLGGGRGGKGSHWGGKGLKGKQGGAGGKGGSSSLIDGAPGFRSATAGSGGGGGGGYGGTRSRIDPPKFFGGGGGGQTAAPDAFGGGGGAGGGASFAAASTVKAHYGGRTPLGDGFAFITPHKPWKPTPSVKVFNCYSGKAQPFTVPAGVEQLMVAVSGAAGGTPFGQAQGEGGARIVATVPVTAGATLRVVTGCRGTSAGGGKGFESGAQGSGLSGGGGGSSALLASDGTTPLVVAGGGNGGGVGAGNGGSGGGNSSVCAAGLGCNPVDVHVNRGDGTILIMAVPTAAVTIPDPPADVTATGGLGQATVSFTPPVDTGNSTITSYVVAATNDDVSATGTGSPITVTGLTQGGVYAFTVTAINASGKSVASAVSNTVSIPQPPGPPTAVSVTTGSGTATVSFGPPEDDGDLSITSYTVTAEPGGQTVSGAGSPLIVTGLISGTSYTFAVEATNALGTGPAAQSDPVPAP